MAVKVFLSDKFSPLCIKTLQEYGFEVVDGSKEDPSEDALIKVAQNFDAIAIRSRTKVRQPVLEQATQLKVVVRGGVGIDNIDHQFAKEKGIAVRNTPKASSNSVAELAIAHMFACLRFIPQGNITLREGQWAKKQLSKGVEVMGKTFGLIGFGNIGRFTAQKALALGMNVIAHDPFVTSTDMPVKLVSKEEVLKEADIISLHIPFIKEEGPAIGAAELAQCKKGVVLINCARGGVVDEAALLDALNSGQVAAAGVDVFVHEKQDQLNLELMRHPNVSVTPHLGASTNEAQDRVGLEVADVLKEFFNM